MKVTLTYSLFFFFKVWYNNFSIVLIIDFSRKTIYIFPMSFIRFGVLMTFIKNYNIIRLIAITNIPVMIPIIE